MLDKQVFEFKEYGTIKINLDTIMVKKNISTYELSSKANIRFQTIQNLRQGTSSRIDLEVLAKLCYVLDCTPNILIEYVPTNKKSKD